MRSTKMIENLMFSVVMQHKIHIIQASHVLKKNLTD
jgi:hypothetical protein